MWLKVKSLTGEMDLYYCIKNIEQVHIEKSKRYDFEKSAYLLKYTIYFNGRALDFETKAEAEKFLKNLMIAVRFANSPSLDRIVPPYIVTVDELKNKVWW